MKRQGSKSGLAFSLPCPDTLHGKATLRRPRTSLSWASPPASTCWLPFGRSRCWRWERSGSRQGDDIGLYGTTTLHEGRWLRKAPIEADLTTVLASRWAQAGGKSKPTARSGLHGLDCSLPVFPSGKNARPSVLRASNWAWSARLLLQCLPSKQKVGVLSTETWLWVSFLTDCPLCTTLWPFPGLSK